MKILHLLASPVWSGPAENVALLAVAQRALGHDVSVAVDRKRPALRYEEPSVPRLRALSLLDEGGMELCVKSLPWRMVADVLALRRRALDVVHAHFSHDHFVARWGRPARAVLVRSIHAPRSLKHCPSAQAWTVPTEREAARVSGRVLVLPPLLGMAFHPPEDRRALQRELGIEGAPVIGMVSTFQPSRRHELGIEAFGRLRDAHPRARLVLVGDGPKAAEIQGMVSARGLQRVHFAGYQSQEAFPRWLQALDVVWILGLGNDYSGRAALQARACGVRVVAVQEGALATLADQVLPEASPEALVRATNESSRRAIDLPANDDVARRVVSLYAACGARS
jgi:glycosyltransferase involved in cell wall biosynthesis